MSTITNLKSKIPIIIGAGPAGAIASLYLSKSKQPHILLDRATFPREKVCGESYDGKVSHILNDLDPTWLPELLEQQILHRSWAYSLTNSKNQRLRVQFPTVRTPRLQGARKELDAFLVEKAQSHTSCDFRSGITVQGIRSTADGKEIILPDGSTLETPLVILATGAQAKLSAMPEGEGLLFARAYFKDLSLPEAREVEVFFFRKPLQACLILCPLPRNRVNVEIGVTKKEFRQFKGSFQRLLEALLQENPALAERFTQAQPEQSLKGTFLQLGKRLPYAEDHLLRAGAAVGSVNPITGYGVGHAMTMGREAAQMALLAMQKQAFSQKALAPYEESVRSTLRDEMRLSRLVTYFHRQVRWLEPMIYWLGKRQNLETKLTDRAFVKSFYRPWFYFNKRESDKT
ncbi:MAG: NAD(P)/FAD-dependent oxidoreductase [Bacteroidota bacterium]